LACSGALHLGAGSNPAVLIQYVGTTFDDGSRRRQFRRRFLKFRRWWFSQQFLGRVQFFRKSLRRFLRQFREQPQFGRVGFAQLGCAQFRRVGFARIEWAQFELGGRLVPLRRA
jgi:hypothetical protein